MIEVQKIANKGRGIIATEDIPQGTLLEFAPVGVFPAEQRAIMNETEVLEYYFVQPLEYTEGKICERIFCFWFSVSLQSHRRA